MGPTTLLRLLSSNDKDICQTAAKALANLAGEESKQEEIVRAGGLAQLLQLLQEGDGDETVHRMAAGAVANLAVSPEYQALLVEQGLLAPLIALAHRAEDPQTLRMVAAALANLCSNPALKRDFADKGGVKNLIFLAQSQHPDVLSQARTIEKSPSFVGPRALGQRRRGAQPSFFCDSSPL